MSEIETLTTEYREHLGDVAPGALEIIDAQAKRIEELELASVQDEVEIRQLKSKRFAPAERAVLDACAEMLLVPEEKRVRVPNEQDIELVAEAEWAKRQEHGIADREEGIDFVDAPAPAGGADTDRSRPVMSLIRKQEARAAELDEQLARARRRIAALEAQVLSADTVSKAEYAAMVQQRDTMREDLKAARHLLTDALPWLKARAHDGTGLEEWLDGQEFYDLMQAYRHMPIAEQAEVTRQYEAIKARLREFSFALEDQADTLPVLGSLIRATEALPPFRA